MVDTLDLSIISDPSINPPNFLIMAADLTEDDVIRLQWSQDPLFATSSETTSVVGATDDLTFSIPVLAGGWWYFRARTERGVTIGDWSNTDLIEFEEPLIRNVTIRYVHHLRSA